MVTADPGRARVAGTIFASCVAVCFGASAVYHRPTWRPRTRSWLARLDHAGIYLLIAGSYAPFGLDRHVERLGDPDPRDHLERRVSRHRPEALLGARAEWLSAAIGLTLGWVGAVAFPQLLKLSLAAILLVVASGLLYTLGAIVYARRRPNPRPLVFGYHELFHVLVVAAVACEYVVVAFYVLPRA